MLKEGQIVKGTIKYIDEFGNGVLVQGKDHVLLRNVFVNEEVSAIIKKRIQKGYVAQIKQMIKPSKDRVKPECGIYERCGSCHLMHMKKDVQSKYKKNMIEELCKKAKLSIKVEDVCTMKDPYHYRNKIIVGFQKDKQRHIQAGFYEEFSHRIIPYKDCHLHPSICDEIIQTITRLLEKFRVELYNEDKRSGMLRHVLIRYGKISKQIMVVLVVQSNVFPARKNFIQVLLKEHPEITTIIQNVNSRKTSVVLGNEERVLYGQGYIEDTLCGCTYRISAKSFYQINHEQTEVLYKMAIERLHLQGNEKVLDAYCGIGTIGMYASQFAKEVIGVEINKDAIADAKVNAKLNAIHNIHFQCDDAGKYMQKMAAKREKLDVVIMDPPRNGSSEAFIQSVAMLKVKEVLYISCNPETQIQDIKLFQKMGYQTEGTMQLVDMFPFTEHVESIVKLVRNK
ncbi:23S rRNA (uracil(1939)-C(5))-methyltransferase RlmD [Amedibacillus sp. YH-ame6]